MYNRGTGRDESELLKGLDFPSARRLANGNLTKAVSKKGKILLLPEKDSWFLLLLFLTELRIDSSWLYVSWTRTTVKCKSREQRLDLALRVCIRWVFSTGLLGHCENCLSEACCSWVNWTVTVVHRFFSKSLTGSLWTSFSSGLSKFPKMNDSFWMLNF